MIRRRYCLLLLLLLLMLRHMRYTPRVTRAICHAPCAEAQRERHANIRAACFFAMMLFAVHCRECCYARHLLHVTREMPCCLPLLRLRH